MTAIDELVDGAVGDSVTRETLTGSERYYPDVSDLFDEEQPHHIVLLTASSDEAISTGVGEDNLYLHTSETVLVVTDRAVHAATDEGDGHVYIPYEGITAVAKSDPTQATADHEILIYAGGIRYTFKVAKYHGDDAVVKEAVRFVHSRLRER